MGFIPTSDSDDAGEVSPEFASELAEIGQRVIAYAKAECWKASQPVSAALVSLTLQSAVIDHVEDDLTVHAHPTRTKQEIEEQVCGLLREIGANFIEHADVRLAESNQ